MKDPNNLLTEADILIIRNHAFEAERQRMLVPELLNLIYKNNWFNIMVPKSLGGLEWEFPKIVRMLESLSWADANLGWCVNLGAGANMFSGYLEKNAAQQIFNSEKTCCAGSGAISGTATKVAGGYKVSGTWKYASGSAHATHFTANCFILDENNNKQFENEKLVFKSFIFPKENVEVKDSWHVIGLKATSSNEFEVNNLFVPENCCFSLIEPSEYAASPLFQFPFELLAVVNMAIAPIGMSQHFIKLFEELMGDKIPLHSVSFLKENDKLQLKFKETTRAFYQLRTEMYEQLEIVWEFYKNNQEPDAVLISGLKSIARKAALQGKQTVLDLFPYCGMSIVYESSPINKVWRDISVACQHYLLSPLF